MTSPTLGRRALNRALLARQGLLEPGPLPAAAALERLVGMQAQAPLAPYVGLRARLQAFQPDKLGRLLTERGAVRMALMRSTIHLVTADDALVLRALLQPAVARQLAGRRFAGYPIEEIAAAATELFDAEPRGWQELGALLNERWPELVPLDLALVARATLPLVQVPPRGVWGGGGLARHSRLERWVGRPMPTAVAPDAVVRRYLAAFGPASVRDVQTWSGLTGLRPVLERMRPQLRSFTGEDGVELLDVLDGLLPEPETPVGVILLPEYDNALLSHADRRRVIADEHRSRLFTRGAVLIDGFVAGAWSVRRAGSGVAAAVEPFAPLPRRVRATVETELARLLDFIAPAADRRAVQVTTGG